MSLPGIFEPSGLPAFLAANHDHQPEEIYAQQSRGTGHARRRRVYTEPQRIVSVSRVLTPAQMQAYDDWFENTIIVGQTHFTAWVANLGAGQLYWDACWIAPYLSEPFATPGGVFWRITGRLLLSGEPSETRPADGEIAVEFIAHLTGAASVVIPVELAVEFTAYLSPATHLAVEFESDLLPVAPYYLEIGDGFFLLIDTTHRLRIG